ncbi:MAG: hypothetical protein JST26_01220 [Bacteroidetes bacterium]|nr:hypothetical protein [Bacteroidota bacterium]
MKKILIPALFAIVFTACKKDRVCECTYPDGSIASQTTFTHVTKKEARNSCTTSQSGITCTVK